MQGDDTLRLILGTGSCECNKISLGGRAAGNLR